MGTFLHLLLALGAALVHVGSGFVTSPGPSISDSVGAPVVSPVVDVVPAPPSFVGVPDELIDGCRWAIGLFDEAGLTLPAVEFVHHGDDTTPCGGYRGVHHQHSDHSTIGLCTTEPGPLTDSTILHELAHAWLEHELPATRRSDFQELRGYEHWRDHDVPWAERGCEQAAEIMVWGLIDRPIGFVTFADAGCDALDAGYRTLTGAAPLHGHRDHC